MAVTRKPCRGPGGCNCARCCRHLAHGRRVNCPGIVGRAVRSDARASPLHLLKLPARYSPAFIGGRRPRREQGARGQPGAVGRCGLVVRRAVAGTLGAAVAGFSARRGEGDRKESVEVLADRG